MKEKGKKRSLSLCVCGFSHDGFRDEGLGCQFQQKGGTYLVDVGQDTTTCDRRADKLVELFITTDG